MAGQEGFEPPTPGFGVRCSTVRATGLHSCSFCFLVNRMGPAETAILLQRKLVRGLLLVPRGGVVPPLAVPASQDDDVCRHLLPFLPFLSGPLGSFPNPPGPKGKGKRSKGISLLPLPFQRYSIISVTTPAPTVLPPSRMAKRSSFSRATGVINSPFMLILSPGMTISTPSGS